MAMGLVKGEGLGLQQGIHELKSAMPPARFNQEMHAHALACSRDQLMMPPLAAQLCSAQISESRAEASALMARQPRLETRDAPAAAQSQLGVPPILGGGDVSVYIKWALVLQEQLAHVQGERAGLAQQVVSLKEENERLRQTLEAGGTATSATPGAAAADLTAANTAANAAVPGAACADAAAAAGDSVETLALSASDRTTTRSAAGEPALPGASGAEQGGDSSGGAARRSARGGGAAGEAPSAAAAFLPPQQGVAAPQGVVPQQGVVMEPAPAGSPPAAAGASAEAAGPSAGGGQKRPLAEEAPPSPFSSPNLRFLAGFLDAPGMPSGGAPPQLWGHAERIGADDGKGPGGGGQAKLQRGANTAKAIGRFDRLQPGR